jgi:hypothetical protein
MRGLQQEEERGASFPTLMGGEVISTLHPHIFHMDSMWNTVQLILGMVLNEDGIQ